MRECVRVKETGLEQRILRLQINKLSRIICLVGKVWRAMDPFFVQVKVTKK